MQEVKLHSNFGPKIPNEIETSRTEFSRSCQIWEPTPECGFRGASQAPNPHPPTRRLFYYNIVMAGGTYDVRTLHNWPSQMNKNLVPGY